MLDERRHWIFDLDGTLTVAVHDFEAIRRSLGLPAGEPILEAIAALPACERPGLYRRLDALELELARAARPQPGAHALLEALRARGARLGILTRNSHANALATLDAAGLGGFFEPARVLCRQSAAPKPDPDGVVRLLGAWGAAAHTGVMVGDYLFDLLAGRAAGVATVYLDPSGAFPFREHADRSVRSLAELLPAPRP